MSHHLATLVSAELISGRRAAGGETQFGFSDAGLLAWSRRLVPRRRGGALAEAIEGDEFDAKVLRDYLDADDRLTRIPAQQKKRRVVLRWLAEHFKPATRYSEKQVNELLARYHPDVASLRRWMVDEELMQRAGGQYWRAGTLPATESRSTSSSAN